MPTVLREDGYSFMIYPKDHIPAHVHALKAGNEARVTLEEPTVISSYGFNFREIARILEIIESHQNELLAAWDKYHEKRS